jgi:UDP-N-acetylmuramate dehydrogenase
MQILENESLKEYTTVKIGGEAKILYFPESIQELIDLIKTMNSEKLYIIGGGSNLLINDKIIFNEVISLKMVDTSIKELGNGKYYIGSSIKLQKLINHINDDGYGGIEYLYSVPALLGGAVAMNAGRGKVHNLCISDYIENVYAYDCNEGVLKIIDKLECRFSYRNSIFKETEMIVLGATFCFEVINKEEALRKKQDRIELVKKVQDNSGFNFGSVFREHNKYIMQLVKLFHPGYKGGMVYSKKTSNWLINQGNGTYDEAIILLKKVIKWHRILGKRAIMEVAVWD